MSGPKVIRIVTREERMRPALRLLDSLESAIARLESETSSSDEVSKASRRRLESLSAAVRSANNFKALERDVKAEIEFVQKRRKAIASAKVERLHQERLRPYSEDCRRQRLDEGRELQTRLHEASAEPLTPYQAAILNDLVGGEEIAVGRFASGTMVPEGVFRLERNMAELEALHPPAAKILADRLSAIGALPQGMRRSMLLSGLLIDLAAAVKENRILAPAAEELMDLAASRDFGPEIAADVKAAIDGRSLAEIQRVRLQLEEILKSADEREFAALRRQTILEGLIELGYTPGEEMETLVEKEGRLVLMAGEGSSYGLEITPAATRAQARVVSFSRESDPEADRAEETRWCEKFAELREKAGLAGSEIIIEKALRPGEVAIKQVAPIRTDRTPTEIARRPRTLSR